MTDKREERMVVDVTDLAQTALAALETADLLADPAERERMRSAAERAVTDIVRLVREFAGLPPKNKPRRNP